MTLIDSVSLCHGTDAYFYHQLIVCCKQMTQSVQFYHSSSAEASSPKKVQL